MTYKFTLLAVVAAVAACGHPTAAQDVVLSESTNFDQFKINIDSFSSVVNTDVALQQLFNGREMGMAHPSIATADAAVPDIESAIRAWVEDCYRRSGSQAGYFIGKFTKDRFGLMAATRVTVIVPSEVFRDVRDEWDRFELLVAVEPSRELSMASVTAARGTRNVWISTENYRRRSRGMLDSGQPSPDWEYLALPDAEATNARLTRIADVLQAEAGSPDPTLSAATNQ